MASDGGTLLILVSLLGCLDVSVGELLTELPYQCSPSGHRVLGNPFRSVSYSATAMSGKLCDKTLDRGWYRFQIFGKYAEMPTECVQVSQCGTDAPMWLDMGGRNHPPPGESARHVACAAWGLGTQRSQQDCCLYSFPITVTNCVDFFVYNLLPARGCNMAYCAMEGREKCVPGQISPDGFAPCRESFPAILGLPIVTPVLFEDVLLKCTFQGLDSGQTSLKGYTVSWYKADSINSFQKVWSEDTFDNFVFINPRDHFHMGDKIFCSVQAFFNETRELKSPAVDSDPFEATIKVSPMSMEIMENGQPHFLMFESTMPIMCADKVAPCSIRVALTTINNEFHLGPDVVLSECFIDFRSRVCLEPRCRRASVLVTAVTDFTRDGRRTSTIVTGAITSTDPFWDGFDPADVEVTVQDVQTAQCYAFTEPHFITFDRKKYDFYKTGTYVLVKSRVREFEVHNRIWNCGGSSDQVSCNCGFVAREDNDVISVDMCDGSVFETIAEVKIRSPLPLSDGVKVKEARNGSKITIEFPSGGFVRADIADWGMSITVQAPSVDFNQTLGLCGTFDGNPDNDFHDTLGETMNMVMKHRQANEFVEQWRLRDGGMFNSVPTTVPFPLQLPSCSCSLSMLAGANSLFPSEDLECIDSINCVRLCTGNEGVSRTDIVQSLDMTSMYNNVVTFPWEPRVKRADTEIERLPKTVATDAHQDSTQEHKITKRFTDFLDLGGDPNFGDFGPESPLFIPDDGNFGSPLIDTYFFYPDHVPTDLEAVVTKWPTTTGITEQQALEICERTIRNSSLGLACGMDTLRTDMFIQDAIEVCLGDIQMTDNIFWSDHAIPLLENQCEAAVVSDRTLWKLNVLELQMDMVPPENIVRALNCPKNCSGNGVCSKLGCVCEAGYSSHDCSQSNVDIPEILRLENNGLCDWRSRSCRRVRVTAREFQEGRAMECHLTRLESSGVERAVFQSSATYINRRSALCHLPSVSGGGTVDKSVTRWEIKMSYRDSQMSSELLFTVYDSHCQQCDWTGSCELKEGACLIDSLCYQRGQVKPEDQCMQCIPDQSVDEWSPNTENQPPVPEDAPPLTFFVGDTIKYQILATDPEGGEVLYAVEAQDNTSDAVVSPDGTFTWQATSQGDYSFAVVITDDCGASALSILQVRVVLCGCLNGGQCVIPTSRDSDSDTTNEADLPRYICDCPPQYSGTLCEVSTEGCVSNPCVHGRCVEENAVYSCQCDEGYTDSICSTPADPCDSQPCYPGVACLTEDSPSGPVFTCGECPGGYTGNGIHCEEIAPSRCRWGCPRRMTCDPSRGCVCREGYAGYRCHQGPNQHVNLIITIPCLAAQCEPECQNGGRCVLPNVCTCKYGYFGPRCQILTCTVNCANGGYCITPNTCKCPLGYSGPTCKLAVCKPSCRNGGRCARPDNCVCLRGFQGAQCQTAICNPSCRNGGTCVRPNMCACPVGYTGTNCAIATCEPRCLNGGRCVKPNKCSCPSGYRGRKCHKAICVSGCRNGGECVKPNVCMCKTGYTGSNCQTPVCRSQCMYGGRCIAPDLCQCRPGHTGTYCQEKTTHSRYKRETDDV
ncbi:von Willebrand factor D and EGF domain-containing protein-like [Acanthaster planci]|uniref:von Willebrand factor D and EGF domain-containing protein-like n=1 Tax=Acanthaster planci TaxID=133434 RepID=A0A8B8A7Q4_ACAPL|nr:von Willebrand factor D and EGF domain-containing protein-like [Acanthaster planci]